ncbi:hypothetical protein Ahy_A05g024818 [Arachis hypogaea]|uniref:MULE transposase domain-containing protein n=1 Tax=Arachis hypogaea TaxID=3818 RepID=A0A445D6S1_ARAHY|nr:hypothetical protein Ahy_A05g024818 [Arachis hypogaea]
MLVFGLFQSPNQEEMLKQQRLLSMFVRCIIENNDKVGIRPSKTYQSFVVAARGHRELNVRNYITRKFSNVSELENTMLIAQSKLLFGLTQEAGLLVSILEMYNLVFGSFVGVNHYGHFALLVCALMKNENIQSFKWLFECWLRCIGGKAIKGILTDQCALMQRAIGSCTPTTIHR